MLGGYFFLTHPVEVGPNLCFRYHVTAKYSAAPAKVVAEKTATKSAFSATTVAGNGNNVCCRFWRLFVAVFGDFCRQCGQAFKLHWRHQVPYLILIDWSRCLMRLSFPN